MTMTDEASIRAWLEWLHGGCAGLTQVCCVGNWVGARFSDLDRAAGYAAALDRGGVEGVYVRVSTLRPDAPTRDGDGRPARGSAVDTAELPVLWADLDYRDAGHKTPPGQRPLPPDEATARTLVADLPEPSAWVHSGGGLYPLWKLTVPVPCVTPQGAFALTGTVFHAVSDLTARWQQHIGQTAEHQGWHYGTGVGDLARVLRVPGTTNRKTGSDRPCRVLTMSGPTYTLAELWAAVPATEAPATRTFAQPATGRRPGTPDTSPVDAFNATANWSDLLTRYGWTHVYDRGDTQHWRRPGKPRGGISATINALGTGRLHVFTENAAPLVGGQSYSPFGFLAAMEHDGDMTACARALREQGYGQLTRDDLSRRNDPLDVYGGAERGQ